MEAVISITYRKSDAEQCRAAQSSMAALRAGFREKGWYPYRIDIGSMEEYIDDSDLFWCKVRELKQVFDPNHIIAPGRYNLV